MKTRNRTPARTLKDIFTFYSKFKTTEELIEFQKIDPTMNLKVVEFEGDKSIIAVVLGNRPERGARQELQEIFAGFHIVMVESGRDPLFNYAHRRTWASPPPTATRQSG